MKIKVLIIYFLLGNLNLFSQSKIFQLSEYYNAEKQVNKLLGVKALVFPFLIENSLKKIDTATIEKLSNWDYYFISKVACRGKKYEIAYKFINKIRGGNFDMNDTLKNDLFVEYLKHDPSFLKYKHKYPKEYENALTLLTQKVNKIKSTPYFDSLYICYYYDQYYRARVNEEIKKKTKNTSKIKEIDSLMRITDKFNEVYVYNLCQKYGYLGWEKAGTILDVMVMHHGTYWYYYLDKMKEAAKASNADWGRYMILQQRAFLYKQTAINHEFQFEEFNFPEFSSNYNDLMIDVIGYLKNICKKKRIIIYLNVSDPNMQINVSRYNKLLKTFSGEINKQQCEVLIRKDLNKGDSHGNTIFVMIKK